MGLFIKLAVAIVWIFFTWLGYIKGISVLGIGKESIAALMAAFAFLIVLLPNRFFKAKVAPSSQSQFAKNVSNSNANQIGGSNSGKIINKKES